MAYWPVGPAGWLHEMLPSGQTCPVPQSCPLRPRRALARCQLQLLAWAGDTGLGSMPARLSGPLESPLSLEQGGEQFMLGEEGRRHPGVTSTSKDQRQGCPQILMGPSSRKPLLHWTSPCPHIAQFLFHLFHFPSLPPPLVSSVTALQRLASPIP